MINPLPNEVMIPLLFILGASIGSFLNVVIYRVPIKISLVKPGSHCISCKSPIKPHDNIPIVSYFFLGGNCRHCSEPFTIRYAIVEILAAALSVWLYFIYGLTPSFFMFLFLAYSLIAISFIDIDHFIIPNGFIILGLVVLVSALALGWLPMHWEDGLYGSLIFSGFLFAMGVVGQFILKKESIGFGDVKLGLILGGFLGLELSILALYLSFLFAAIVVVSMVITGTAERGMKIPFGPYLAGGTLATLLTNSLAHGNMILNWYFSTIF